MDVILFPLTQYWWLYALFIVFVCGMLVLDLGVFHKNAHTVSFKEAGIWSLVWVTLALCFGYGLYHYALHAFPLDPRLTAIPGFVPEAAAKQVALEFMTGFVVEKSLAIDNIFIFALVFSYFAIPQAYQHRVLFFGVLGALVFRAIFIALGAVLMQYHWVVLVFGGFLILTGVKTMLKPDNHQDPGQNPLVKWTRKHLPITPNLHGQKFFVRHEGVLHATPLLLALVFLEFSDIIFAVDSVPAIFAITKEPFIVFTSNIFAILGLRSMFFLIAGLLPMFRFLRYGLGVILVFVGLKMVWLNQAFGGKFPIHWSLGIIASVLIASIVASLIWREDVKDGGSEGAGKNPPAAPV